MTGAGAPILERDRELDLANGALEAARGGNGRVVLVSGPAGIGKTRLLSELRERAPELRLLSARGGELERQLPWGVVRQLLDPVLSTLSPADRDELFTGAGRLAASIFEGDLREGATGRDLAALVYGLYWVLTGLSARGPVALVVDDAHWADDESLRWLAFIGARLDGLRASIFAAVRSGDPGAARSPLVELAASAESVVVEPAPLSEDGAAALISSVGGVRAEPLFVAACQRVAVGNPFLLQELIRQLSAERVDPTDANVERVASLRPGTIARSVILRLARLPPEATALAQAVAVLGPGQEARDAAALAGLDAGAAALAHQSLAESHILAAGERPEFVHPLVGSAVYEDLPALVRAQSH
ncbi:MAG: hypothetical protein QOJ22_896, partial [Thermoleophilaceae bacterium]|nr:hypothetical protein [Thermoleophilaceae bacterium]